MTDRLEPDVVPALPYPGVALVAGVNLVTASEHAAQAAARLSGCGDADRIKTAAAGAMMHGLEELGIRGRVVLGPRGDRILSHGSVVGPPGPVELDLAVYPVEGASLVARGLPHGISVLAAVEPNMFPNLPAVWYVEKMVAGSSARGAIDLDDSVADNLRRIAFARDVRVSDLVVAVLDRPRHQDLIAEVRSTGARLLILEEGEIAAALLAAEEKSGVDATVGVGGLQETILAAAIVRCLGGELQARLWPRNDEERLLAGEDFARTYSVAELAPPAVTVAVTGITGGPLLDPVWFGSGWTETSSLVMASHLTTVRRIRTRHLRSGER